MTEKTTSEEFGLPHSITGSKVEVSDLDLKFDTGLWYLPHPESPIKVLIKNVWPMVNSCVLIIGYVANIETDAYVNEQSFILSAEDAEKWIELK